MFKEQLLRAVHDRDQLQNRLDDASHETTQLQNRCSTAEATVASLTSECERLQHDLAEGLATDQAISARAASELRRLKSEVALLERQLEASRHNEEAHESKISMLQGREGQLQSEVYKLQEQEVALLSEIESLRNKCQAFETTEEHEQTVLDLRAEIAALKDQLGSISDKEPELNSLLSRNRELEEQVAQMTLDTTRWEDMSQQNNALELELKTLREKPVSTADSAVVEEMRQQKDAEIRKLQKQLQKTKTEVSELTEEVKAANSLANKSKLESAATQDIQAKVSELESKVSELDALYSAEQQECAKIKTELQTVRAKRDALLPQTEGLRAQLSETRQNLHSVEDQLQTLQRNCDAKAKEVQCVSVELQQSRQDCESMSRQLQELTRLQDEIERLNRLVTDKQQVIDAMSDRGAKLEREKDQALNSSQEMTGQLHHLVQAQRETEERLRSSTHNNVVNQAVRAERDALLGKVESLTKELANVRAQVIECNSLDVLILFLAILHFVKNQE